MARRAEASADLKSLQQKIRARLDDLDLSAHRASEEAGLGATAVRDILKMQKGYPTARTLKQLAGRLGFQAAELLLGDISDQLTAPSQSHPLLQSSSPPGSTQPARSYGRDPVLLPVRGWVQAGAWQEVAEMDDVAIERQTMMAADLDQRFPLKNQFFLEIRGDSMDAAHPDPLTPGCFIHCVDFEACAGYLRSGVIAVVHRYSDDRQFVEATVKRVRLFDTYIELAPESTNPKRKPYTIPRDDRHNDAGETIIIVALVLRKYGESLL